MMGLKRNLFPEHPVTIPEDSLFTSSTQRIGKSGPDRRKRKRNTAMASKVVESDSLASAPLGKENILSVKTKKGSRQRKGKNTSILMGLDTKENKSNTKEGRQRTRQQKVISGQNCITKSTKNRRVLSDTTGSVLVCFESTLGSSSQGPSHLPSKRGKGAQPSKKITVRSKIKPKPKHKKRPNTKKTITKRVCMKESEAKGDSLMTCLAETSKPLIETVLPEIKFTREQTKCHGGRRKQTEKASNNNRSRIGESTDASDPRNESQVNSKRAAATFCKVGGLGAFVGITGEGLQRRNLKREQHITRLVSPLENDSKTNSHASGKDQETNTSKQEMGRKIEDIVSDSPALDEIPSVIIISLPQQQKQLQQQSSPETTITTDTQSNLKTDLNEDEIRAKSQKVKDRKPSRSKESIAPSQIQSKYETDSRSRISTKQKEKKSFDQKFIVGTKFQKNFKFHGWFSGTVVSFDPETGFYKVNYEDGDSEELEESDLERCKLELNPSEGASSDRKLQNLAGEQESGVAEEEAAPLTKLRPKSDGSIKSADNEQSNVTNNRSLRRSRRRKSQPVRLIDAEEATQTTGSKKTKRSDKNLDIKSKPTVSAEDQESDRSCSPLNRRGSHDKQHFDDALKAVMPIEDIVPRPTHNSEEIQDDIFNSTPMRKLFTKRLSNDCESSSANRGREQNGKAERRSRRKSVEPERYGYHAESSTESSKKSNKSDSEARSADRLVKSNSETKTSKKKESTTRSSKTTTKSAMKKSKRKTKGSTTAKKRVRISIEPPGVTNIESDDDENEVEQWTKDDLRALHQAHRAVDPTSFSFWEDVSEIIGNRSAFDCRQKWFSLAKTPEPKKSKQKKGTNTMSNVQNAVDDIFNSTPMRSAFAIGESIDISSTEFEELGDFSKINVGSAIKINRSDQNEERPSNQNLVSCPHGYKTYLQKMGRIMRQKDTKKRQQSEHTNDANLAIGKKFAERIDEGDVQVKGRLSPGGTLRVDTFGYSDAEDYLDYDDETEI